MVQVQKSIPSFFMKKIVVFFFFEVNLMIPFLILKHYHVSFVSNCIIYYLAIFFFSNNMHSVSIDILNPSVGIIHSFYFT